MNPAVTFAMCFLAREPWIKLPIYALAQTLGAFLGAGIVFGLYYGKRSPSCPSPRALPFEVPVGTKPIDDSWACPSPVLMTHSLTLRLRLGALGERNKFGHNRISQPPPALPPVPLE